jgi:hypothetical protein
MFWLHIIDWYVKSSPILVKILQLSNICYVKVKSKYLTFIPATKFKIETAKMYLCN